ncbi:hemogen isoform X2 [Brachyhypopomus gauderio]|uniref:hemogen isoform X2 n=1 Tax=Brachyhypopomus gauderio TaxID=698409 RepID=UPI004043747A
MEETLEKENPVDTKAPDSDEGGIGRRLRDRDLLRKRKAEAEEKATNQAQSRKRARKEPSNTPGKKGRPRKTTPAADPQTDQARLQAAHQPEMPIPVQQPAPVPVLTPHTASAPAVTQQPPELLPAPATGVALEEVPSSKAVGEVLIEDLGPDEEEDRPQPPEGLVIDQGAYEEPAVGLAELNKAFSEPVLAPPPAPTQQAYIPGNVL